MITSDFLASWRTLGAGTAPLTTSAAVLRLVWSYATTLKPLFRSLRAMICPIAPSPMNPIVEFCEIIVLILLENRESEQHRNSCRDHERQSDHCETERRVVFFVGAIRNRARVNYFRVVGHNIRKMPVNLCVFRFHFPQPLTRLGVTNHRTIRVLFDFTKKTRS